MILVDSSVWIDYFKGADSVHTEFLEQRLGVEPVAIGDLMLTEVLQGFRDDTDGNVTDNRGFAVVHRFQ